VVTGLALALAPIDRTWGVASATIVTLQAFSGAGLAGVSGLALTGNVIPWIEGEEEKIGPELRKVLGSELAVAVAVNRVPVVDGHTAHVFLRLERPARVGEVRDVLRSFSPPEGISALPSSLDFPVTVLERPDRPQPRLDARRSSGMAVTVGRVRTAPPYDLAMTLVVHNAIRGAAGACLANAELCVARGWVASSGRAIHRSTAPLAGGAS
jgi:aspartate-semialdehyde dehydrogenase